MLLNSKSAAVVGSTTAISAGISRALATAGADIVP
jgi:hypothetical protein